MQAAVVRLKKSALDQPNPAPKPGRRLALPINGSSRGVQFTQPGCDIANSFGKTGFVMPKRASSSNLAAKTEPVRSEGPRLTRTASTHRAEQRTRAGTATLLPRPTDPGYLYRAKR